MFGPALAGQEIKDSRSWKGSGGLEDSCSMPRLSGVHVEKEPEVGSLRRRLKASQNTQVGLGCPSQLDSLSPLLEMGQTAPMKISLWRPDIRDGEDMRHPQASQMHHLSLHSDSFPP